MPEDQPIFVNWVRDTFRRLTSDLLDGPDPRPTPEERAREMEASIGADPFSIYRTWDSGTALTVERLREARDVLREHSTPYEPLTFRGMPVVTSNDSNNYTITASNSSVNTGQLHAYIEGNGEWSASSQLSVTAEPSYEISYQLNPDGNLVPQPRRMYEYKTETGYPVMYTRGPDEVARAARDYVLSHPEEEIEFGTNEAFKRAVSDILGVGTSGIALNAGPFHGYDFTQVLADLFLQGRFTENPHCYLLMRGGIILHPYSPEIIGIFAKQDLDRHPERYNFPFGQETAGQIRVRSAFGYALTGDASMAVKISTRIKNYWHHNHGIRVGIDFEGFDLTNREWKQFIEENIGRTPQINNVEIECKNGHITVIDGRRNPEFYFGRCSTKDCGLIIDWKNEVSEAKKAS